MIERLEKTIIVTIVLPFLLLIVLALPIIAFIRPDVVNIYNNEL